MTKQPKAKPVAQQQYQVNKGNVVVPFMHAALLAASPVDAPSDNYGVC